MVGGGGGVIFYSDWILHGSEVESEVYGREDPAGSFRNCYMACTLRGTFQDPIARACVGFQNWWTEDDSEDSRNDMAAEQIRLGFNGNRRERCL